MAAAKMSNGASDDSSSATILTSRPPKSPSPDPSEVSVTTASSDRSIFKGHVWENQIEFREWKQHIDAQLKEMDSLPEVTKIDYVFSQLDGQALEFMEYALKTGGNSVNARRMVHRLTEKYDPVISLIDIRLG